MFSKEQNLTDARMRPQVTLLAAELVCSWSGRQSVGLPRRGPPFTFQSLFLHGCQGPTLSPALEVAGACGQEHIVGVPVQAEDGGANGLLDVLAYPPEYGSQTGKGREEQTGGQPTGLSAPGTLGSHWVLQTTEVPRGRSLGTVSP